MKIYVTYILTNKNNDVLYIGVTNDLKCRVIEHKLGLIDGFSKKYNLKKLVYFDQFNYIEDSIRREKQLKRWRREWKINLVTERNPEWEDLYSEFFGSIEEEYINYILNLHTSKKELRF